MFKRLRIKLTVFCATVTAVILGGMAVASLLMTEKTLAQRGSATFTASVNSILYHLSSQRVLDHTWLSQTESNGKLMLYLEDSGKPLLYSGAWNREQRAALLPLAQAAAMEQHGFYIDRPPTNRLQSQQVLYTFTDDTGEDCYAAAAVVPLQKGWVGLVVVKPMGEERAEVAMLRNRYIFLIGGSVVLLVGFAWVFTGWAIRPIEENRKRQMAFVAAASHELRSPLAVVESSTTAAMEAPPDRARRFQETVLAECHRMSRLVGDMLLLASADNRSWSIQRAPAEPETLLLCAAEAFEEAAAKKSIHVTTQLPEVPLPRCNWDGERVTQVLTILLDNAVSYTEQGGRITLSAKKIRDRVELRVADNGPGISDEDKKKIFSRFYRADASRTQKEHYGLGLSIAQEIVRLHKGSIRVEDLPGGGTVFIVGLGVG